MSDPLATARPPARVLLEQAVDTVSAASEDALDARSARHRVASGAVDAGELELALRLADELDSPAHRAHLLAYLSRAADRLGRLDEAREWAQDAVVALDGAGRWRPVLPDWVGTDSARADLAALLVTLGDDRAAAVVSRPVRPGTVWNVQVVAALAHLLSAEDGWDMVVSSVRAVARPADRARAVMGVMATGHPRPRLGPSSGHSLAVIDAVLHEHTDEPGAVLAAAQVAARLARVLLDVPALTAAVDAWGRAVALAHQLPGAHPGSVAVLCTVTRDQIRRVGPGPAKVTWQGLLARLAATPLPPDPPQHGPWSDILGLALHHPSLAAQLSRVVARHAAVPSGWAHALGRLHLSAGRPERALRVAEVLAEAAERHPEDVESRLLAGLLRARAGRVDEAWDDLLGAIDADSERLVWLADAAGPRRYEWWAVEALLAGGSHDLAVLLARLVSAPDLRARLLARCVGHMPAGEGAAALAEEAAAAVGEARAAGLPVALDADLARLPQACWESGDPVGAEAQLSQLVGGLIAVSEAGWLDGVAHLHAMLDQIGAGSEPWTDALTDGWHRRVDAAEPEARVDLLLGWASLV